MANTYLSRTPSSAGNRQTWTISAWVKRGTLGTYQNIVCSRSDANNALHLCFTDADQLMYQHYLGGSVLGELKTNRKFRDVNCWYNVVVTFDSTNGTAGDRQRMWINGVEETSFATDTNISQNQTSDWNDISNTMYIGQGGNSNNYWTGSMSYVAFIDGTAEAPSIFGETDSTTGEWKIKNPTPSSAWGTNGFLILKDGNTGTDQSTNSNNFAVGGGTLTKTEDCPSNVFATINQLQIEGGSSSALTFSNGNTKVTRSGNWRGHMSTLGVNKGKWYWEVKQTGNVALGIGKFGGDVDSWNYLAGGQSWLGDKNDVWISYNNSNTQVKYTGSSSGGNWHPVYADGEIISIAFDADNGAIWQGINGTWMNSATETEIENGTTTNAMYSSISIGNDFFGALGSVENGNLEYNFGNGYFGTTAVSSAGTNVSGLGIFEYDVPDGFTALCTKGLNE